MFRRVLASLIIVVTLAACWNRPTPLPEPTPTPTLPPPTPTPQLSDTPAWFRQAVLYQIFPRSFYDSNGDGIGDLGGITQKLDYLRDLGVTAVWVTSVLSATSPHGYDVTDHLSIAPALGTQQDMITLVNEAHARGMRVLIDLMAGHTSNKHLFFQDAYRKPASNYSGWYLWKNDAQTAYQAVNDDKGIPLLNMGNPNAQAYMLSVARHWMDLNGDGNLTDGVDGLVDRAQFAPPVFWRALRQQVKAANPDFLLLGYAPGETPQTIAPYYDVQFDAMLDTPLQHILTGSSDDHGDGVLNNLESPILAIEQLELQTQVYPPSAQIVQWLNSHVTNRVASEVGGNPARAKQAAGLLLTLPGTPMLYYGEEIGMRGVVGAAADGSKVSGERDTYQREPMDWYAAESGPGMPTWFKPDNRNNRPDDVVSVEEETGTNSLLEFYRTVIAQRRQHPALSAGGFQPAKVEQCGACMAYWRWDDNDIYLLVFNLAGETQAATIDFTNAPRLPQGSGKDVLRGGTVSVPSNGRYTATIEASGVRILYWGKP